MVPALGLPRFYSLILWYRAEFESSKPCRTENFSCPFSQFILCALLSSKNFTPPRQPHLTGTTQVGSFALHPASLFQDHPICHLCPFEASRPQPDSQNEQRDCASHHPGYVLFLPPSWAGTSSDSPPTFYPAIPEPTMYTHPGTTPFQSNTSPIQPLLYGTSYLALLPPFPMAS